MDYVYGAYPKHSKMKLRFVEDPDEAELFRRDLAIQREKDAACTISSVCAQCHLEETSANLKTHWKKQYVLAPILSSISFISNFFRHGRPAVDGDILPKIDYRRLSESYYAWPPRDDEEHELIPGTEIAPIKPTTSKNGAR